MHVKNTLERVLFQTICAVFLTGAIHWGLEQSVSGIVFYEVVKGDGGGEGGRGGPHSLHINISSQAVASGRSTAFKERCLISFECNHGSWTGRLAPLFPVDLDLLIVLIIIIRVEFQSALFLK